RAGTRRSCLFLCLSSRGFLHALGVTNLWSQGWVERIDPAPRPWGVAAQQCLLMVLESGQITQTELVKRVHGFFPELDASAVRTLVAHLLAEAWLSESGGGVVQVGPRTAREYGRAHYRDLLATFSSAQL